MRIAPFDAVRPTPENVARVASVPYDTVDRDEARRLAEGLPDSFLRVIRADLEMGDAEDPYAEKVYARAAQNFRRLRETGVLVRETEPALYVYRQTQGSHAQCGVVGCCHTGDYESGVILRHEAVRPAKVRDRVRLMRALGAQSGPVFLTYRRCAAVDEQVTAAQAAPPLFDFTAEDGVRHTVWRVPEPGSLVEAFAGVPAAYIADGHHRAASAAELAAAAGDTASGPTGTPPPWFLCVLYPHDAVRILGYHRCVADLNGMQPETFLATLADRFALAETADPEPPARGVATLYVNGRWRRLQLAVDPPLDVFDADLLQRDVLEPLLGIVDPRTDPRIDFVGGSRGTAELRRRVDSGAAAVAMALHPITIDMLMRTADNARTLPPKSTWFEPKLRSGLFVHAWR